MEVPLREIKGAQLKNRFISKFPTQQYDIILGMTLL